MSVLSSDDNVDKTLEQRNRDSIKNDEEIEKANEFLNKNRYEFKEYRKLSINIQRRFLYKAIQILIGKEDNDMVVSTMNICFEFLKSNRTESLKLNDELYLYKDKDEFYFGSPIELMIVIRLKSINLESMISIQFIWIYLIHLYIK